MKKKSFVTNDKKLEKYLNDYLNDKTGVVTIEEAIKEAKNK